MLDGYGDITELLATEVRLRPGQHLPRIERILSVGAEDEGDPKARGFRVVTARMPRRRRRTCCIVYGCSPSLGCARRTPS